MKLITGEVVDGKVQLPPGELPDGAAVAVVAIDDSEPVVLTAEQAHEIELALEEIARGEFVDGDELLARIMARHTA